MKYRKLGKTGLEISEIGFGAWAIGGSWGEQDESVSEKTLISAIERGVNFIDTAALYGDGKSEQIIGRVLKKLDKEVYIATKIPPAAGSWPISPYCDEEDRYSEKYLRKNLERCLRNLDTDCIDVLQLHTWTRAWNRNPKAFDLLRKFKDEGKARFVGVSTPEHDQNAVIDLMKNGHVDTVQVIYNIFEQEPAAELLPVAMETGTGIIVRMAFDEGVLTGKYTKDHVFPEGDFRRDYFSGDRLRIAVEKVERIREDTKSCGLTLPQLALKFVLSHPAVSTVISGMRNPDQAQANISVSDLPELSKELLDILHRHIWLKGFWYNHTPFWWEGLPEM